MHVIAKTGGEEDEHAKLMAYAWQLWTESRLADEMNRLHEQGLMDLEEWAWVDACLLAASGNVLTSVVSARYGGRKIVATG